jgi:hypothetical protein
VVALCALAFLAALLRLGASVEPLLPLLGGRSWWYGGILGG